MRQNYRFQILAPANATGQAFGRFKKNQHLHRQLLDDAQRLRGRVYLKDGAIQPAELDSDGRFHMRADESSWHLLLVEGARNVIGCARYLVHRNDVPFHKLRISHSALAKDFVSGPKVRAAVERDLAIAREKRFSYVEIGGWALAEEWRGSRAALEILVGSYALASLWGGCLGVCTATVRHGSSSMLRRIGGTGLTHENQELPAYEDPQYNCLMELLRFDYRTPASRFAPLIAQMKSALAETVAVTPDPVRDWMALPKEVAATRLRLQMATV